MRQGYKILVMVVCAMAMFAVPMQAKAAAGAYIKEAEYDSFRAVFDAQYYYDTYEDLQVAIGFDEEKLFQHFIKFGLYEGRSSSAEFNLLAYRRNHEDLQQAFGDNYGAYCRHYIMYGREENRVASSEELYAAQAGTELGKYTTMYNTVESRATNIEVSASRINGVVLEPGQSFSFSKTVLPRTRANGYVQGPVIIGGRIVDGMGGGICQVSSTLYAAMTYAGIPATERYPHSLNMDYVPRGLDATIASPYKDLKFTNTLDYPIQITAVTQSGALTVSIAPYEAEPAEAESDQAVPDEAVPNEVEQ